jgi:xanthine dehydrogenase molybdopterin-binding subunit B
MFLFTRQTYSLLSSTDETQIKLGSQYYFYMETQTALAVPDEDNCITVYSSTQSPQLVHSTIARCLGIPENNVRVITRRVGGGFGGKGVRSVSVSFYSFLLSFLKIFLLYYKTSITFLV